ncbi:rod-binding protein [Candidatus Methylomirabilis sp.]|uniref:rod-binding protein n=1 Tax=Candidatus Methylomirabilis sp. TaxID=2032687 RepID=UPI002A68F36C|nr:rod-binding protein [Candidatus Methylomirabilis sp.]
MELTGISPGPHAAQQPARPTEQKLKEVAQEFEAILIASLLKEARPSGQATPLAGGLSHDLYQQLFTDEVAKAIARSGGIGVGKMLERQLRGMLQAQDPVVSLLNSHENQLKAPSQPADSTKRGGHGVSPLEGVRR